MQALGRALTNAVKTNTPLNPRSLPLTKSFSLSSQAFNQQKDRANLEKKPPTNSPVAPENPWNLLTSSILSHDASAYGTSRSSLGGDFSGANLRTKEEDFEHYWKHRHVFGGNSAQKDVSGPSAGRTVILDGRHVDVGRAMSSLNGILRRNEIRRELQLGDRYEKPNQKRRRLRSERHRRRFAHMVREKVKLVSMKIRLTSHD